MHCRSLRVTHSFTGVQTALRLLMGEEAHAIVSHLLRASPDSKLDVIVCTHNDADHANGVWGVLEAGIPCREVWLPGRWTERLTDLLANPSKFYDELYNDWVRSRKRYAEGTTLDEIGDVLARDPPPRYVEARGDNSIVKSLENAAEASSYSLPEKFLFKFEARRWIVHGERDAGILAEAVEAASRIKKIALAAFHAGSTIRWFEFGSCGKSVYPIVAPLNSHEIMKMRRRVLGALDYLALSKANKESLVFHVAPTKKHPGVIFSGDSDSQFSFKPEIGGNYLITAPHHGSESNSHAYTALESILKTACVVRSDGRYRSRPGRSFLSLPCKRYCTTCRGTSTLKQTVELVSKKSDWVASQSVRQCKCKCI
jgi:hypothetical protein